MSDLKDYTQSEASLPNTGGCIPPYQSSSVCPTCGRCPTCGQGGYWGRPYYPYWPQITWGGETSGTGTVFVNTPIPDPDHTQSKP